MKVLFFSAGGFIVYYKRLERGRFCMPHVPETASRVVLDAASLAMLRPARPGPFSDWSESEADALSIRGELHAGPLSAFAVAPCFDFGQWRIAPGQQDDAGDHGADADDHERPAAEASIEGCSNAVVLRAGLRDEDAADNARCTDR